MSFVTAGTSVITRARHRWPGNRAAIGAGMIAGCCLGWATANATPPLAPVVIDEPSLQQVVEKVPVSGTVTSPRVARLSTEVDGLVQDIHVDAGTHVDKGDTLITLDATLARLALDGAAAATELASEELSDAKRRLADARRLVKSRGIPETEVEARRSEVRADGATLRLREAAQQREQERLDRHFLKAPFAGVISRKLSEQGEWVAPGDAVLELVADSGLRVDFPVPQRYFARLSNDTSIEVRVDGSLIDAFDAKVGEVIPVSDPNARTFVVRVYLPSDTLPLIPGMSASGTIALATGERSLVVSRDAILRHPDGRTTVWVIEQSGDDTSVVEKLVQTGLAFDGKIGVSGGLDAGDRVVTEGNEALQPGQRVTIRTNR